MIDHNRIQRVLNRLQYDFNAFKLSHFTRHLESYRQRRILCIAHPFSPGISGAWVPGRSIDFVFYQAHTHLIHQQHIMLHEFAHMLLEHPLQPIDQLLPPELLNELSATRQNKPRGYLRSLEVNRMKDVYEQEAEYFVTLIQRHVVRVHRLVELTTGDSSIEDLKPFVRGLPFQNARWEGQE